ncbi:DNA cytosine methyltransferase [Streptococcus uberis]|uniref:DNA cytosine methyltransferase n=2 Tax=Streptococcus uberis TaxID=1349 RepID=UPI000620379D|nr:DNA cytosine methyltransferase [Streptococcus uberis]KKF55575.1 DNA methyltransferase [Streptococcus uberis 6780]MCK1160275.1 DNA cytosine methyltransferase [Streptococcus uberis]MCK1193597.1 DNA cytosine methyltransferase [Streptococcus uberis]MCK1194261.1 DNA cytosine methyltransferase [Streptococcus uberis]MCK1198273.1 DNA cytosine methyltransferase [Streptococcus uberis]
MQKKIKIADLFSGAGGLLEGFMQSGLYEPKASVEWEKAPVDTLRHRLKSKWKIEDSEESVLWFDMQRENELFNGFDDEKFGKSKGLDFYLSEGIDVIIGGPPCQAYSQAGRTKDKFGMKFDYRNYLFEHYLNTVERYQPKLFVFENVPGMLSAMPDGTPIVDLIKADVQKKGYEIVENIKQHALIDISEFGVPQNRKRVILVGIKREKLSYDECQEKLISFYDEILPKFKANKKISVQEAIGDLPKLKPLKEPITIKSIGKQSHELSDLDPKWGHIARFQNERDINIFGILAEDISSGENRLQNADSLNEIYNKATGGNSKVHKYHVLRKDLPSTTITAHLHKDGLRFIHFDPDQKRTITVREAARLQSFPDDFEFLSTRGNQYKMIGNAVPPEFARRLSLAIHEFLQQLK